MRFLTILAGLLCLLWASVSEAQAPASIRNSVAVCDPLAPSQCYSPGNRSANITSAVTTLIKTGPGSLVRIVVNKGATTSTATIYDNTAGSGTKLATLDTTAVGSFTYEIAFKVGLTIVTSSTADITVAYQ